MIRSWFLILFFWSFSNFFYILNDKSSANHQMLRWHFLKLGCINVIMIYSSHHSSNRETACNVPPPCPPTPPARARRRLSRPTGGQQRVGGPNLIAFQEIYFKIQSFFQYLCYRHSVFFSKAHLHPWICLFTFLLSSSQLLEYLWISPTLSGLELVFMFIKRKAKYFINVIMFCYI